MLRKCVIFASLVVATSAALLAPSLIFGATFGDSAIFNYVWTAQFAERLAAGDLYPRWLPRSFGGLGSPAFYFYPPLAYYVGAALQLAGLSTVRAVAGSALLAFVASGVSMGAWLRSRGAAPAWALLFLAMPYHLYDWYQRAALGEIWALAWVPLVALCLEHRPGRFVGPALAASFAGLIFSHMPLAVLASTFLFAPMIVSNPGLMRRNIAWLALGAGLAAIYLVPALTLQDRVLMSTMWRPMFRTDLWTIWGPNLASMPIVPMLVSLATALVAPDRWRRIALVAAAAAFGVLPAMWRLPALDHVQFPWRLAGVLDFLAVTAIAGSRLRLPRLALAMALLALWANFIPQALALTPRPMLAWAVAGMEDAREYLPAGTRPGIVDELGPLDRAAVATPTLGPAWPPEAKVGAWISLLAFAALLASARSSIVAVKRDDRPVHEAAA